MVWLLIRKPGLVPQETEQNNIIDSWGKPEQTPLLQENGTVVHVQRTAGLQHTSVDLVWWFM